LPYLNHSFWLEEGWRSMVSHLSCDDTFVSDNQKIFLCREKLTQFTFSRIIPDEKAETLRSAILDSVLHIMPPSGTTVRVDAAPGLQSINKAYDDIQTDDVLKKHSIKLEIGRTINPNKNPIAENDIKEFRKERLRLNPRGGPISENERIIITRNMNSRIRNRGLSSKEMLLRRDISQNKPIHIEDEKLSNLQFNLRSDVNQKRYPLHRLHALPAHLGEETGHSTVTLEKITYIRTGRTVYTYLIHNSYIASFHSYVKKMVLCYHNLCFHAH